MRTPKALRIRLRLSTFITNSFRSYVAQTASLRPTGVSWPRGASRRLALHRVNKLIASMMALSIMNLFGLVAFGSSKNPGPTQVGMIKTDGIVSINGARATSGQTVFSGSSITTEMQSESLINLDNRARLKLNEATALTLAFSRFGLTGSLSDGQVNTSVPAGFLAEIKTADASVINSPAEPATFSIRVDACSTNLSVQTGQVEVRAWNRVHSVRAGESFSTAEVFPAAPQQNLSQRKRLGLFVGIGAAVGVLLIVLTGHHDKPQTENFGGCVIILSPGGPNTCP